MIFKRRPPAEMQGKLFLSNKTHFPSPSAQNEAGDRVSGKCLCVCCVLVSSDDLNQQFDVCVILSVS